jgi:hypothetical protein
MRRASLCLAFLLTLVASSAAPLDAQFAQSNVDFAFLYVLDPGVVFQSYNWHATKTPQTNPHRRAFVPVVTPTAVNPTTVFSMLARGSWARIRYFARARFQNLSFDPADVTVVWSVLVDQTVDPVFRSYAIAETFMSFSHTGGFSRSLFAHDDEPTESRLELVTGTRTFALPGASTSATGRVVPGRGEVDIFAQDRTFVHSTVPEPASILLLGTGLLGIVGVVRRRRSRIADL